MRTGTPLAAAIPPTRLAVLLAMGLAGCQSLPPTATPAPPEPYRNVYTQDKDSAPAIRRDIDYHSIPDAEPRAEPRGKYGNKSPYTVLGKRYEVLADARGFRETGGASWYGEKFQGFRTSSLEPYDMYAMTAAHKTLPIPSYVRVTNLANKRSVVVRINDRGPFHADRIIDLSWAAAQKLGYANVGTARVLVEAITPDAAAAAPVTQPVPAGFYVQLGAFTKPEAAGRLAETARVVMGDRVVIVAGDDDLHRVRVGPYEDRPNAERTRDMLYSAGVGAPTLVVVP